MFLLYNFFTHIAWGVLKFLAVFNPKIKLFVLGRSETFQLLRGKIAGGDKIIWMHVASLGEFEQGLPVIERLKIENPSHKILITFFSPSGFEVKKNTTAADIVAYLPMDSNRNVKKFLEITKPKLAIFVKYEIWPNYLRELKKRAVPTILISAIFRKKQVYFKWYGTFLRNALGAFSHFFLQDKGSKKLLKSIDITNTTVNGDTRLDRVSEILDRDNTLEFMTVFKNDTLCFVAGSTWPEDEKILVDYINSNQSPIKFVVAPHTIHPDKVLELKKRFTKKTALYSKLKAYNLKNCDILIIDSIGLLTKVYSYADMAYVGGAFSTGLHNTLEPAVFGIPVIIGPNYKGFKEAEELVMQKGILTITGARPFNRLMQKLVTDGKFRKLTGEINKKYIAGNKGASIQILEHIRRLL
ncbi:3-deoxy-D-manno-octulosonic acid transferase [Costertonia aggregata]|uniref:3-deoxy-D-manno-octulosonic acid transferase n=1 Tax=Costertonia aggregata TaxID=343403 RepID=A0A7H9AME4_9FLAO|nr:glycosyltransferase N-terminal domain-containing protein [Costertonia aggregata]QLG44626.1 3-deoxy-D-manno-octulosonic acid transferase [Costertonia aggregata]